MIGAKRFQRSAVAAIIVLHLVGQKVVIRNMIIAKNIKRF
jgi:hypothetical protein